MTKKEFVKRVLADQKARKLARIKKNRQIDKEYDNYLVEASARVKAYRGLKCYEK